MLTTMRGNMWDYHPYNWCVVTTNIGWNKNGNNIMGAGVARTAGIYHPFLAEWYGKECMAHKEDIGAIPYINANLIMFPTKSLNPQAPHLSWQQNSTLDRIERSLKSLVENIDTFLTHLNSPIYMPPPGCGNGGLEIEDVYPLLDEYLSDSPAQFILIHKTK